MGALTAGDSAECFRSRQPRTTPGVLCSRPGLSNSVTEWRVAGPSPTELPAPMGDHGPLARTSRTLGSAAAPLPPELRYWDRDGSARSSRLGQTFVQRLRVLACATGRLTDVRSWLIWLAVLQGSAAEFDVVQGKVGHVPCLGVCGSGADGFGVVDRV